MTKLHEADRRQIREWVQRRARGIPQCEIGRELLETLQRLNPTLNRDGTRPLVALYLVEARRVQRELRDEAVRSEASRWLEAELAGYGVAV